MNDEKEGQGQYFHVKGFRYVGHWKNNKKNGEGLLISDKGNKYTGFLEKFYCFPIIYLSSGFFLNDKKHGKGISKRKNKEYIEEWKEGLLISRKGVDDDFKSEGIMITEENEKPRNIIKDAPHSENFKKDGNF